MGKFSFARHTCTYTYMLKDELQCFPSHFSGPTPTPSFQHSSQVTFLTLAFSVFIQAFHQTPFVPLVLSQLILVTSNLLQPICHYVYFYQWYGRTMISNTVVLILDFFCCFWIFLLNFVYYRPNATESFAIESRNVKFAIRTKHKKLVHILEDCSIQIPSGQFWMLLGPNGCGKSTLLKVVC